jgi:hypothetical protein
MARLTPEEKAKRSRQRMIEKAKESPSRHKARVAIIFQRMIRAEAAALPYGPTPAIVAGEITEVWRNVGQCVCVTCGKVAAWTTEHGTMEAGHFLQSRCNSILFESDGVWPQCSHCNKYLGGAQQAYQKWMLAVHGEETVERLECLKRQIVQFTPDQLVDMRIQFAARLKDAEERMK